MKNWNIPMPKEAPRDGLTHLAIACKDANGRRVEFRCQIATDVAAELVTKIIMEAAIQPPKGGGES